MIPFADLRIGDVIDYYGQRAEVVAIARTPETTVLRHTAAEVEIAIDNGETRVERGDDADETYYVEEVEDAVELVDELSPHSGKVEKTLRVRPRVVQVEKHRSVPVYRTLPVKTIVRLYVPDLPIAVVRNPSSEQAKEWARTSGYTAHELVKRTTERELREWAFEEWTDG